MTPRTRRRIGTVVLAPVAALAAWAVIRLLGIDLAVSVGDGTVGPVDVVVVAVLSALAGWGLVRLLERYSRFPQSRWPFVGSTAIAISINGPGWLSEGASMAALIVLHFVVGIVVIVGFAPTLPYVRADEARAMADRNHAESGMRGGQAG